MSRELLKEADCTAKCFYRDRSESCDRRQSAIRTEGIRTQLAFPAFTCVAGRSLESGDQTELRRLAAHLQREVVQYASYVGPHDEKPSDSEAGSSSSLIRQRKRTFISMQAFCYI
jgi:hypothetical protein